MIGPLALLLALGPAAPDYERGPGTARDEDCLVCHAGLGEETAPKIDLARYREAAHAVEGCVGCHTEVLNATIDHEEEDEDLPPVDCGRCHDASVAELRRSAHRPEALEPSGSATSAVSNARGPERVATCADCHGSHGVFPSADLRSRVNRVAQNATCGACHEDHRPTGHGPSAALVGALAAEDLEALADLATSEEDLPAGCADCHGGHRAQPATEPDSRLHPSNQSATCGPCHSDAASAFVASAHAAAAREEGFTWAAALEAGPGEAPPVCSSCHELHGDRGLPGSPRFRRELARECGACHAGLMATYAKSRHGKTTFAGGAAAAKCSDCHGFHAVRALDDPASEVHPDRRLDTCRSCHPGAPEGYASYWTHVDPRDPRDRPLAFFVFAGVLALSGSVLVFFGLHTLLWAARQIVEVFAARSSPGAREDGPTLRRESRGERGLYLVATSAIFGLAATGAPLSLSRASWARPLLSVVGGPEGASLAHRLFALVLFGCFFAWLVLLRARIVPHLKDASLLEVLLGPASLLPRREDVGDVVRHVRWFFGLGPKPTWDRWAYWEKFDHWALFWIVPIIGGTGLVLWFPEAVASLLPGWVINLAALVHAEQALIAVGFIFGIHAFHRHLRREVFPADPSVFTGRVPVERLRRERPREHARLVANGELEARLAPAPSPAQRRLARALGVVTWGLGFGLLALVVHGLVTTS